MPYGQEIAMLKLGLCCSPVISSQSLSAEAWGRSQATTTGIFGALHFNFINTILPTLHSLFIQSLMLYNHSRW